MELHEALDYRQYLKFRLDANRQVRGYRARLAAAAGCQLSYLSQVLHSHVELTPDHAAGLCAFWGFDEEQTAYFVALVHWSRASSRVWRRFLERQLAAYRAKRAQLAQRIGPVDELGAEYRARYYSAWFYSAIHVLLLIPELRTVAAIADRLRLDRALVANALSVLESMGLARRDGTRWLAVTPDLHLAAGSAFAPVQHAHWRHRVAQSIAENPQAGLHYTGVHALSRDDVERIRQILLEAVERARGIIRPSREQTLACLLIDWQEL